MRVTNNMINMHSQTNINGVKNMVDKYNDQMTNQNKISKPSDDPVIAIRSLRLRDSLNEVSQYVEKNIPDAESWMEVTETSLNNMEQVLDDIYENCVYGSTGTLTSEDRNTLLENLTKLVEQLYAEGNTDYAGRTVFTGFKTNSTLTFQQDDTTSRYSITEKMDISDLTKKSFFTNELILPATEAEIQGGYALEDQAKEVVVDRIRLAYDKVQEGMMPTVMIGNQRLEDLTVNYTDENGVAQTAQVNFTEITYDDWAAADFEVDPNQAYYIATTGELILGSAVAEHIRVEAAANKDFAMQVTYEKTGFNVGDVRPEMYFDCSNITDPARPVDFTREVQDISYIISANLDMNVNTQAGEDGILSTSIARDVDELLDAVTRAQNAEKKVVSLEGMLRNAKYADDESQASLKQWLEAAKKEQTLADENLQSLFSDGITLFQGYKDVVDLAKTDVGSRANRLQLVKTRMTTQQSTIKTLISRNEDREMSDVLIDYKAAYTAYESALSAASKANSTSLLDFL